MVQRWVRYSAGGSIGFGSLIGETIKVHSGCMFNAAVATGIEIALTDVKLLAPVVPGKVSDQYNPAAQWRSDIYGIGTLSNAFS